jgi:hemoglobin-like flavoprotein
MRMTPTQAELVRSSWTKLLQSSDTAADDIARQFYDKLFDLDPSLSVLFRDDMKQQGRKLMAMISFAVQGLMRLEIISPGIQALGRRHAGYGADDRHYSMVAIALLWTLAHRLGDDFTAEMREAWATAYGVVASIMRDSAKLAA